MLQALVSSARHLLDDLNRSLFRPARPPSASRLAAPTALRGLEPLQRVLLTDGVGRTLFEEYAAHRLEVRGDEETGWLLLGLREPQQAVVLATLPAGAERDASVAHVRFNSNGQALGSRIVRQSDRRLVPLGLVHTHPGSLRHPTDGDYRGDIEWVQHLRGGEGIFGIGTAEDSNGADPMFASQPRPHVQCLGDLRLSWYALREGDARYRPLPMSLTLGPDLARPLHCVWPTIEAHSDRLDRLCRQQAGVVFNVEEHPNGPRLVVQVPLAEPGDRIRITLTEKAVQYFLVRGDDVIETATPDERVDRGVYLLLAELAGQS